MNEMNADVLKIPRKRISLYLEWSKKKRIHNLTISVRRNEYFTTARREKEKPIL